MTNDMRYADVQPSGDAGLESFYGADIGNVTDWTPYERDSSQIKPEKPARWRGNAMGDAEEPTTPRNGKASGNMHCRFLPDISLRTPFPPEPVGIADMANIFGVTHRTLHFYEEKSLIASRRAGLMRIYMHDDVRRMAVINFCREIGIPVASIQDIMQKLDNARTQDEADALFETLLMARKTELTSDIANIRQQIEKINDALTLDNFEEDADDEATDETDIALSAEERKCLELMAEGYAPVRLARALDLSADELQKLENGIMEKFSAKNRFQAVAKAVLLGVISA